MRRTVLGAQSTGVLRDVRVTTASIVCVDDRLRVNVCEVVSWSMLLEGKSSYKKTQR